MKSTVVRVERRADVVTMMIEIEMAVEVHDCRFSVAGWLEHSPANARGNGFAPPFQGNVGDLFLESIQSPAWRDQKWYV